LVGLWQIADMERDGGSVDMVAAQRDMLSYVDAGFTTFDMADHYGSAELIAGAFKKDLDDPERTRLLTKWVPKPGPLSAADVREGVERSLQRLDTDRIDLLQFHAWNYADPSWLDGLFFLQELQEEGLVRHLGLTNVDAAHLNMALQSGIDVVSNQVCFSLLDRRPLGGLTRVCQAHGIQLLAYGTVAGGLLTERWLGKPEPSWDGLTWSQMKYRRFVEQAGGWEALQALLVDVKAVADELGVSMANVSCRYVLDQPAVGGIIVGARLGKSDHLADNRRLFSFEFTPDQRARLDAASARLDPIPGDSGDEYRRPPFLTASGDLSHHLESFPPPYPSRPGPDGRTWVLTGTPWETIGGFARAVRKGDRAWISGTTATHRDRAIGGDDLEAQTHFIIDKIDGALQSLGGGLTDVVRTRVFLQNAEDWEPVTRVHGERFADILPANTLVQAGVIGDEYRVEIEAEAVISP